MCDFLSPSRHVLAHHEEAREASVQPHISTGLLATTQHFLSISPPRTNRCRTQWWVAEDPDHCPVWWSWYLMDFSFLLNTVEKSMLILHLAFRSMLIALSQSLPPSWLLCLFPWQLYRRGAPLHTRPCSSLPRLSCPRHRQPTSHTAPSATRPTSTLLILSRAMCRRTTRPARRAARSVLKLNIFLLNLISFKKHDLQVKAEFGSTSCSQVTACYLIWLHIWLEVR